jgi:hypothetical protein
MGIAINAEGGCRAARGTDAIGKLNQVALTGNAARGSWRVDNLAHGD